VRRLLVLVCLLTPAPAAEARWFAARTVDGAGPVARPVVDLAREEGGGLVYVKLGRAWLSRLRDGAWTTPVAVSGPGTTEAVVAAGERGRLVVAWIQGGIVYGAVAGTAPVALSAGGGASGLAADVGVNGVAYAVWSHAGDVRAARLDGAWATVPRPLDVDPAHAAGGGRARPRVAVAADGTAVVVWGEALPDGRTHVFARRVYGTTPSLLPQDAGSPADSPEVDVEYDRSFAWVAFRQDVGGFSRAIARRLRASSFDAPFALAPGAATEAHLAMSSLGIGHAVGVTADGRLFGAPLRGDRLGPAVAVAAGGVSGAAVVTSERNRSALIWRAGSVIRGRLAPQDGRLGRVATLARGAAPGPLSAASNRIGDVAAAVVRGGSVGVAMYDLPPSRPVLRSIPGAVGRRPLIRWTPGQEFLGRQRFRVLIDGRRVTTTRRTRYRPRRLAGGTHRVQVVAVDRRGQRSDASRHDTFRVR
jgi:hypothetical protein